MDRLARLTGGQVFQAEAAVAPHYRGPQPGRRRA
jgi:hypothetical protein